MFRATITFLGILYFLAILAWTLYLVCRQSTRDRRLEDAGTVVRGIPGLLIAGSLWLPQRYSWLAVLLNVLSIGLLIVGPALYELVVFRNHWRDR